MGQEVLLFKNKERISRNEAADFLRQLADKVSQGNVLLKQGSEEVQLSLPDNVILEVEVEDEQKRRKGVQHKIEVELKWYEGDDQRGPMELG